MHRLTTVIFGFIMFFNVHSQFDNAQLKVLLEKHAIKTQDAAVQMQQVNELAHSKQKDLDDLYTRQKQIRGFIAIRGVALAMGLPCLWVCWNENIVRKMILFSEIFFAARVAYGAYHLHKAHDDIQKTSIDLKEIVQLQAVLSQQNVQATANKNC